MPRIIFVRPACGIELQTSRLAGGQDWGRITERTSQLAEKLPTAHEIPSAPVHFMEDRQKQTARLALKGHPFDLTRWPMRTKQLQFASNKIIEAVYLAVVLSREHLKNDCTVWVRMAHKDCMKLYGMWTEIRSPFKPLFDFLQIKLRRFLFIPVFEKYNTSVGAVIRRF